MRTLLLGGEVVTATVAPAGLVAEVAPAIDVLPVTITRASQLAKKPPHAFAAHKQALDSVGAAPRGELGAAVAYVVDRWFGDEATARRPALLVEKLAKNGVNGACRGLDGDPAADHPSSASLLDPAYLVSNSARPGAYEHPTPGPEGKAGG